MAETTQLAAWASYDAGLHGLAQRYLVQALTMARFGGSITWVFSTVLLQLATEDRYRGRVFAANFNPDFVARLRPSPDGIHLAALQHHVVAEDRTD